MKDRTKRTCQAEDEGLQSQMKTLLLELPKGFMLTVDAPGRGQNSWLEFHSYGLYRISFRGFKKGRKWMDYIRIILFSVQEGI